MTTEFKDDIHVALIDIDCGADMLEKALASGYIDSLSVAEFALRRHHKTIKRALMIVDKLMQKDVVMCVKKQHLPEHDGATGYFYYEEIEE